MPAGNFRIFSTSPLHCGSGPVIQTAPRPCWCRTRSSVVMAAETDWMRESTVLFASLISAARGSWSILSIGLACLLVPTAITAGAAENGDRGGGGDWPGGGGGGANAPAPAQAAILSRPAAC